MCAWREQSLTSGDEGLPLSAVEMLRDPSKGRCSWLRSCSPAPGLRTPSALQEGAGEQMSLVLKLIIDSGE